VQEKAFANKKIDFILSSQVTAIEGDKGVERIQLTDNDGQETTLAVDGIFILIGVIPNNEMLPLDLLQAEHNGFIPTDNETRTAIPGVMAAGDIRSKEMRQIVNAAGEGATAVLAAEHYLNHLTI
jgi:thioredoxin reductase (NADPH)